MINVYHTIKEITMLEIINTENSANHERYQGIILVVNGMSSDLSALGTC